MRTLRIILKNDKEILDAVIINLQKRKQTHLRLNFMILIKSKTDKNLKSSFGFLHNMFFIRLRIYT